MILKDVMNRLLMFGNGNLCYISKDELKVIKKCKLLKALGYKLIINNSKEIILCKNREALIIKQYGINIEEIIW